MNTTLTDILLACAMVNIIILGVTRTNKHEVRELIQQELELRQLINEIPQGKPSL